MTPEQEKDFALRARRAHERKYGQSTWIEAHCLKESDGVLGGIPCYLVRVWDNELGITTYWKVIAFTGRRRIRFQKQFGERR